MQINTMKKYVELISSLQAHHLNIYVGSPFVPRQKKMVVEMRIQPEIDKIGASLCNKSVSNIPPVMFPVFGTEDEVFLVQCASTSRKCSCKEEPLTILQATACTSE